MAAGLDKQKKIATDHEGYWGSGYTNRQGGLKQKTAHFSVYILTPVSILGPLV